MPAPTSPEPPRSVVASLRAYWPLVLACVLAQAALGVLAARIYFAQHNTLVANGNWVATKTTLARGLNGSFAFVTGRQALAGEKLDLGAWHSFQEVIHKRQIDAPRRIALDFELSPGADLAVLFNRTPDGAASGVRLSATRRHPSCYFVADADGEFLSRQPLRRTSFASGVEHRLRILLGPDELAVEVDGEPVGVFAFARRDRQSFGFRGSAASVVIDDIEVLTESGAAVREDWDAAHVAPWLTRGLVGGLIALNLLLYLALHRFGRDDAKILTFKFVLANLTLGIVAAIVFVYVLRSAEWYPGLDDAMQESERYFRRGSAVQVLEDILTEHPVEPAPGAARLLFLGTSQTWGAGALRDEQAWVPVLESLLAEDPGGRSFECVNAGFSALRSTELVPLLRGALMPLRPRMVVINLGNNDRDAATYEANLRALVEIASAGGAQPVLVLEANERSFRSAGQQAMYRAMRRVGEDHEVPVIDMNQRLLELEDTGFVWWDKVHFTNYGHRLMARLMAEELRAIGLPDPAGPPAAARQEPVGRPEDGTPAPLAGAWTARVADGQGNRYALRLELDGGDAALGGRFEVVDRQAGGALTGAATVGGARLELAWAEPCSDVVWTLIARRQAPRLVGAFAGAMCTGETNAGWVVATRE